MAEETETPVDSSNDAHAETGSTKSGLRSKLIVVGVVGLLMALAYANHDQLTLQALAQRENQLKEIQQAQPLLVFGGAFVVYVLVTGLSLPGAAVMTLVMGWYFGFTASLVLVSFASTTGATFAFTLSRYLFRDAVEARFGKRLVAFNAALEREGAFYLLTLRLIPAVPFFVINIVMGLTKIRVWTYWWVSQLGMLAGTAVFCYAGSRVPNLTELSEKGAGAVFSKEQLFQITVAFVLLGTFPLIIKKLLPDRSKPRTQA